jgi:hypothetical protein
MRRMTRTLQTVDQVIDKLGGTVRTSELAGVRPSQVSGWRSAKRLGTKSYLVLKQELETRGFTAPAKLWGIDEPERAS